MRMVDILQGRMVDIDKDTDVVRGVGVVKILKGG
jgi:hypothetical protein